jgi:serine/threonine protein kinase
MTETRCSVCQNILPVPAREALLYGRYRLLSQIGVGSFGIVYQAEDRYQPGESVAIKEITLPGLSPQQVIEATETYQRERALLTRLNHPHLPHVQHAFGDTEHWYLVMDYFPGETLETYIAARQQGVRFASTSSLHDRVEEVLRCGLALCEILGYLHAQNPPVIFHDLKPGKIIRSVYGVYALVGFGIASTGNADHRAGPLSPGYAAPEHYGPAQIDERVDIYSLGVILYQLLSGDDPGERSVQVWPAEYTDPLLKLLAGLITRIVTS